MFSDRSIIIRAIMTFNPIIADGTDGTENMAVDHLISQQLATTA